MVLVRCKAGEVAGRLRLRRRGSEALLAASSDDVPLVASGCGRPSSLEDEGCTERIACQKAMSDEEQAGGQQERQAGNR